MTTNNYKVKGTSREVGAIGIFEPFTENVSAVSSQEAYTQVRESLYAANREHVLVWSIHISYGDGEYDWGLVEPRAYLP